MDVRIPGDSSGRVLFAPGMPGSPLSERLPEDAGVEEMEEKREGGVREGRGEEWMVRWRFVQRLAAASACPKPSAHLSSHRCERLEQPPPAPSGTTARRTRAKVPTAAGPARRPSLSRKGCEPAPWEVLSRLSRALRRSARGPATLPPPPLPPTPPCLQAGRPKKRKSVDSTYLHGICIESIPDSAHFSITYALSVMGWSLGTARNR